MLRHPVQWLRDHPQIWDALLALTGAVISIVGLLTIEPTSDAHRGADAVGVLLVVAVWSAVAFRRRWPEWALWTGTSVIIVYWVAGYVDSATSLAVLLLIYTVAAHIDRPRSLRIGLAVGIVLTAVMVSGVVFDEDELPPVAVIANAIIFATAWTIGDSVRSRHAYLAEVEARAERAEREREEAAERAVQDERVRIARELHDVVAHSVSVMVVQAGAARRVLDRHPEQTAEALAVIERTGRNALDELRRLLGVLRAEQAEVAVSPQPTADDVADLVEQWRRAGLDVDLRVVGDPPELAPGVSLTVYRVVQEALTNVMKHAGPAHADVVVRFDGEIEVEVTDDGRGPLRDPTVPSAGQGLVGMRERIELFGGQLAVGPRPGGGFRLRATIPLLPAAIA